MLSLRYSVGSFHKDNYDEDEASVQDTIEVKNRQYSIGKYL